MAELDIAVIGMACRVPGASNLERFWDNLRHGRESITFFCDEELDPASRWLLSRPEFVKAGAILEDIDLFDAAFFKMSAREAELTDPQHRMFLECVVTALEDAGYGDFERSSLTSLYAGSWMSTYGARTAGRLDSPANEFEALLANGIDYLATRASYKLNLKGESVAVQTACSTSLVAVHLACQSLLSGQSDMAIAGGVSVEAKQKTGYLYQEGMIYSPDGHCRPFDHRAQGTIRANGLGVVVLKRLGDAIRDHDHIYAVIKSSVINNDGYGKAGFAAPSVDGQCAAIEAALAVADIPANTIGYVEAHGTGTPLGDPIEIEALKMAFRTKETAFCAIGSIKSNFGHLVEAAGVVGLIKAALVVRSGEIPPTLHFTKPNPHIDFSRTPFYVNREASSVSTLNARRRAGVSSFGIGGTNAHVVIEQPPQRLATYSAPPYAILLSGDTPEALEALRRSLSNYIEQNGELSLGDVSFTLAVGRRSLRYRWACVVESRFELLEVLRHKPEPELHCSSLSTGLITLVNAWLDGRSVDWQLHFKATSCARVPLPTYPFQRSRFWLEERAREPARFQGGLPWLGAITRDGGGTDVDRVKLLLLSADAVGPLRERVETLRSALMHASADLGDFCIGANAASDRGYHRLAIVFSSRNDLVERLDMFLTGRTSAADLVFGTSSGKSSASSSPVKAANGREWDNSYCRNRSSSKQSTNVTNFCVSLAQTWFWQPNFPRAKAGIQ
ncbi:MAG: hypothetical protein JOZ83_16395 [Silvibacterium sp.]|nr:hypothetical protein [Silvibacterium sp.]